MVKWSLPVSVTAGQSRQTRMCKTMSVASFHEAGVPMMPAQMPTSTHPDGRGVHTAVEDNFMRTRKGYKLGRVLVTTTIQAQGAPFIDCACAKDGDGLNYRAIAILLTPWRRNRFGESEIQTALVIGLRR